MLKLINDEDAKGSIVSGLFELRPELDLVRVIDIGLGGRHDLEVLEWAASEDRILITNDRKTMTRFARERIENGLTVPGVIVTTGARTIAEAIEDILMIADCMPEQEIRNQVIFLPV